MGLIFLSATGALFLGLGLVFIINGVGFEIFQFVFQRGAFTLEDTISTVAYAKDLSFAFIFIFIASVFFQPFFTLPSEYLKKESKKFAVVFLVSICAILSYYQFFPSSANEQSLIMMYSLSLVYFIISIFSFFKYYKFVS